MDSCSLKSENTTDIMWINEDQGYFVDLRDQHKYAVVRAGSQIWFAENLAYKPGNGDFWPYDNDESHVARYGYLYYWETARSSCPEGWHLPSMEEWNTLVDYLGGKEVAGGKLKSVDAWNSSKQGATNSSGFEVLPGGNKAVGGEFYHLGDDALLWSSTPKSELSAWKIRLTDAWDSVNFQACSRLTGLSVRCIKD
jgi:uncharacterized protein (TIGR02145 family)